MSTQPREALWQAGSPAYARILEHPFVRGLAEGTLPEPCFRHYALQDSLYLRDFGRGLATLAAAAPKDEYRALLCNHAANAVAVERALHAGFIAAWNLSGAERDVDASPTALLYSSFLVRAAAERPFIEGLAAFLPCYWIYLEVGRSLVARGSPHPLYARWIDTYADPAFAAVVEEVLAVYDAEAADAGAGTLENCAALFARAAELEWMFWDAAWRRETWPLATTPK